MDNAKPLKKTDAELVAAASSGDEEAFQSIMDRYGKTVATYLLAKTANPGLVEDIAQEVFLTAFVDLGRLKKRDALGAWLLGIARNKFKESARKGIREREVLVAEAKQVARRSHGSSPGSFEKAEANELSGTVLSVIGGLNGKYQDVLMMRLAEERAFQEIAEALGIKESTARMRFKRGAAMLRKALSKRGLGPMDVKTKSGGKRDD